MNSDQDKKTSKGSNKPNNPSRQSTQSLQEQPLRQDNMLFGQVPASELRQRLASALRADLSAMQSGSSSPLNLRTPPGTNRRDDNRGMGA